MQFRCYTCAFVFHDGMPPMEALSDQQSALVTGEVRTGDLDFRLLLLDTVYSGLTPANFCTPCLTAIVDCPAAFREDREGHDLDQNPNAIWCTCGTTLWTSRVDRTKKGTDYYGTGADWVEVNRLMMRHRADSCLDMG